MAIWLRINLAIFSSGMIYLKTEMFLFDDD